MTAKKVNKPKPDGRGKHGKQGRKESGMHKYTMQLDPEVIKELDEKLEGLGNQVSRNIYIQNLIIDNLKSFK